MQDAGFRLSILSLFNPYSWLVVYRNFVVWRSFLIPSIIGNFGEPILYLLAMGFGLGRMILPEKLGGVPYDVFLAPGLLVSTAMYTATFECTFGSFTRLKTQKIFEGILTTPVQVGELAAGEILFGALKSSIGVSIVLLVLLLFGLIWSPLAVLTIPAGFIVGFMFSSAALIVTSFSPDYQFFNYYFTVIIAPMFLFSGIFFPINEMPDWVRTLAWFFPLTHAVDICRSLTTGALHSDFSVKILWMLLFCLFAFEIAVRRISKRLIK